MTCPAVLLSERRSAGSLRYFVLQKVKPGFHLLGSSHLFDGFTRAVTTSVVLVQTRARVSGSRPALLQNGRDNGTDNGTDTGTDTGTDNGTSGCDMF